VTALLRQRKRGIILLFLIHGLVEATWVSRIPQVREYLHAQTGTFGLALLGSAAGAMLSMPLTGWMLARFEGRRILIVSSVLWCAALPLMGFANSLPALTVALTVYGMVGGAMDIAMNSFGAAVDQELPRPVMSFFHGMFSAGGMVGAAVGVLVVRFGIGVRTHFLVASALLMVAAAACAVLFPVTPAKPREPTTGWSLPARPLLALGALAFCILFGERAMADWTGIYLVQRGATNAYAAAGYAAFSAAMTAGRFTGDWLIHRFGSALTLQGGSGIATAGLLVGLWVGTPAAGLAGFALVGAGFAVVVPILYRAANAVQETSVGLAIATVTTLGYFGFFVGPPLVGFAAQAITLRWALLIVALLSATVFLSARRALRIR
jgi:MFS family permease